MSKIVIIGLGAGNPRNLSREARKYLAGGLPLYFRTINHPAARFYAERNRKSKSFDAFFSNNFSEQDSSTITHRLIKEARKHRVICYAVPGNPLTGDETVKQLQKLCVSFQIELKVVEGPGYLESLLDILKIDSTDGVTVCDVLVLDRLKVKSSNHLVVTGTSSRALVSTARQKLAKIYPEDYPVVGVKQTGMRTGKLFKAPLHKIDQVKDKCFYSALYLEPFQQGKIEDLIAIMAALRSEKGCPWDKKQDHRSLRQYLVEEAYEVVAAIDREDEDALQEELGDVLLQVVFHSQIAREEKRFDFYKVVELIVAKLIRRHPHVFGADSAADAAQVKVLWERIKSEERSEKATSSLVSIDHGLPALLKAYKIQKKAAGVGFDWPCIQGPLDKAREELDELEEAFRQKDLKALEEELGDYLFSIVNISRFLEVNPEMALGKTIDKFIDRFSYVMQKVDEAGRPASSFSLEELDKWWEEAKKIRKICR